MPSSALACLKVDPGFHPVWYWPALPPCSACIHSLRFCAHLGWVGPSQGLTCTSGWRRTAAAAEAPPTPHSFPGHVQEGLAGPQKQQTADSPPCSGCCPWPPLSPRLSPAERLAFRQGREGSGVMGSYPQRRIVCKAKPVTASRTQRPLMGVLTRPPICPLPLLVCPSPGCGVWGERKGRTIE